MAKKEEEEEEETVFESLKTLERAVYMECVHEGPLQPQVTESLKCLHGWKLVVPAVCVIV